MQDDLTKMQGGIGEFFIILHINFLNFIYETIFRILEGGTGGFCIGTVELRTA